MGMGSILTTTVAQTVLTKGSYISYSGIDYAWVPCVAVDLANNVYIGTWAGTGALNVASANGAYTVSWGTYASYYYYGAGITIDSAGALWYSRYYNGGGSSGSLLKLSFSSPGVPSGAPVVIGPTTLTYPAGLCVDNINGYVYYSSGGSSNMLNKMIITGSSSVLWTATTTIGNIHQAALDPGNYNIYIAGSGGVQSYNPAGTLLFTFTTVNTGGVAYISPGVIIASSFATTNYNQLWYYNTNTGLQTSSYTLSSAITGSAVLTFGNVYVSPQNFSVVVADQRVINFLWWIQLPCTTPPAVPSNGNLGSCAYGADTGASCSIGCNFGYVVQGANYVCQSGGFTGSQSCVLSTATCPLPSVINGWYGNCTATLAAGTTCSIACNSGKTCVHSSHRDCGSKYQLTNFFSPPVSCLFILCRVLPCR